MHFNNKLAFTLVEVLITLIILSILAALSIPSFSTVREHMYAQGLNEQLFSAIKLARNEAMVRNAIVQLDLASKDKILIKTSDEILHVYLMPNLKGKIQFRAFPYQVNQLRFFPDGTSHAENGTFWFCSQHDAQARWSIVINKAGRARNVMPGVKGEVRDGKGDVLIC